MLEISLNVYYTIALAILVLLLGDYIKKHVAVLRKFCIPTPVVGGVLFAVLITILNISGICQVSLNSSFNEFFSLLFYAGIGYTASWKLLKKGGPQVIVFLILSSILVALQNGLGVLICNIMGIDPLVGLACGSIPMVGGNGTAAAWGPVLEKAGLDAGTTIATAAATFGLVGGALLGGPIGRYLIEHNKLTPNPEAQNMKFGSEEEKNSGGRKAYDCCRLPSSVHRGCRNFDFPPASAYWYRVPRLCGRNDCCRHPAQCRRPQ